jgi:hypothetical protein
MDLSAILPQPLRDYFASADWRFTFFIIRLVSGALSAVIFAGIVYLVIKTNAIGVKIESYSEAISKKSLVVPKKKMAKQWEKIKKLVESDYDADYKLALLDADKVFDEVLKLAGLAGKDMAERMKSLNVEQLSNIEDAWWAHKLRNSMVHDTRFKLTHGDAKKAVDIFEKSLKEFEALE